MPLTTDIDLDYNALLEGDAGGGADFPWERGQAYQYSAAFDHILKPPTGGGHGGGGGGGGTTFTPQALAFAAGPDFTTNGMVNGNYFIPPDSTSAAGTSKIIVGVNGVVEIFDHPAAGSTTLTGHTPVSLDSIFSGATGFLGSAFDPHILYDPNNGGHFIFVAVDQSSTGKTSQLLVAVSDNDGANIHAVAIDATKAVTGGGSWADFPQVGLDASGHIYITANMFSFSGSAYTGTRLWVENESSLSANVTALDVSAAGGANDFFSAAPTYMPNANGNFLISYNSATNTAGHNVLHAIHVNTDGTLGAEQVIDLGSKIDQLTTFGGISVPQPGTSQTLDADDSRTSMAVLGNQHLYVAATTIPVSGAADAGNATVHWWGLNADTTTGMVTFYDQGAVSGSAFAPGMRTFYPSVAVGTGPNGLDELAIGFSGSAPQTSTTYDGYASAYEVTFDPTQTNVGAWHLLQGGVASYYRTFGSHDNRWGDYSSISVDPTNHSQYWAFNEYAMSQGTSLLGENGRWATELGLFE